jgi:nitrogen fixation NifU-like protein
MNELRELYQEYVLDHGRNPRNFHLPERATHHAEGYNPLCGDKLTLELVVEESRIVDIGFVGAGCAISTASASSMTEAVKGMTVEEARDAFGVFVAMAKGEGGPEFHTESDEVDKLAVFAGVSEFPMRVKCATLAWHTLSAALDGEGSISTE